MGTMTDAINKNKQDENEAYEQMINKQGKYKRITNIGNWIKENQNGKAYMYAMGKMVHVSHIRWPESNPWAVCPEENAGFGLSYCVHHGVRLFIY